MQEFQVPDDPLKKPSGESEDRLILFHIRGIPAAITSIGVIQTLFKKGDQCGINAGSLKDCRGTLNTLPSCRMKGSKGNPHEAFSLVLHNHHIRRFLGFR